MWNPENREKNCSPTSKNIHRIPLKSWSMQHTRVQFFGGVYFCFSKLVFFFFLFFWRGGGAVKIPLHKTTCHQIPYIKQWLNNFFRKQTFAIPFKKVACKGDHTIQPIPLNLLRWKTLSFPVTDFDLVVNEVNQN